MSFSIFGLDKLNKFLIVVFFLCCVYLFGGVSNISKFFLFIILFLIFLINFFLNKFKNLINKFFVVFLLFLVYLIINAFLFSKVQFESKLEFLNFILYVLVFYTFANIKDDSVEIWHLSFFLIQFSFLLLYLIYKEKIIYFFVYNPNVFSGWSLFSFLFSLFSIYKYKLINFFSIFNLIVSFLFLIILKNFSGIYIALIFLSLMFIKNRVFSVVLLFSILTIGMVFKFSSIFDRVIWLIISIKIWLQHLFFGVGLGNFKFYYQQYSLHLPVTSTATLFVHNYFLHILSEIGIIGGAFLFFVIFYSLVPKKKIYFYPVLGILLQNLIDYNLLIPMNGVLLFSSLGCLSKEKEFFVGN
ncbi:MAG: O-antigen ligase family protein [Endomicrobia bacterium]|nr:O-antigen ligase family protein [Endomicrobiia bacterium]